MVLFTGSGCTAAVQKMVRPCFRYALMLPAYGCLLSTFLHGVKRVDCDVVLFTGSGCTAAVQKMVCMRVHAFVLSPLYMYMLMLPLSVFPNILSN